jgi:S-(hydroxymethyl)glutathione dehydrogenase/alcohol dehydrogenase
MLGGMTVMRGAVFLGPRQPLSIEELRLDAPRAGEVRVRMVASGVCHSDLHVVDGEWQRPPGVVLGHEGAAIVEELGPGVAERATDAQLSGEGSRGTGGLRVGDLVVLAWTAPCDHCTACLRAQAWLCATPDGAGHRLATELVRLRRPDGSAVGAYSGIGTHATHQVVAASAAIPIDPRTPHDVAALIGCAATTGVGAVRNTAAVQTGETVVIIGLGGVGLSAVMAAADAGASRVIAIDREPAKLELARRCGATDAVEPAAADQVVQRLTHGGADHVFEAIGLPTTVELAVELTRPGGTVTLVGMTPQGQRAGIDVYRFVEDGKRMLGSNYGSAVPARDFPSIASAVVAGRLPMQRLVSERIELDAIDAALNAMRRRDGARRVIVFSA